MVTIRQSLMVRVSFHTMGGRDIDTVLICRIAVAGGLAEFLSPSSGDRAGYVVFSAMRCVLEANYTPRVHQCRSEFGFPHRMLV